MPTKSTTSFARGQEFGRWTVDGDLESQGKRRFVWCRCRCGSRKRIRTDALGSGDTLSCGCWAKELNAKAHTKSNLSRTSIYRIWWHIIDRCYNPECHAYDNYGARGIKMHDRWKQSVNAFSEDIKSEIGERPSGEHELDRIDNDGNYEPGNVRWADRPTQVRNRRVTITLTLGDTTRSMAEWSEITGIKYYTLKMRRQLGWSDERTLTAPVCGKKNGEHLYAKH